MVGFFHRLSISDAERIVVGASDRVGNSKTITDFYTFYSTNGHYCVRKKGIQFIEDRFAQPDRKS